MRINPVFEYGQNFKCCKPRKNVNQNNIQNNKQNQNVSFGSYYDDRACEATKKFAGSDMEIVTDIGDSKFLEVYHGWDKKDREYVLKAELNEDYMKTKDATVQKRVKDMVSQAQNNDFLDLNHADLNLDVLANLAYQLKPYEQYDKSYPFVRSDNAYYVCASSFDKEI